MNSRRSSISDISKRQSNMKRSVLLFILLAGFFSACTEIFEEDISDKQIEILAPADNLVTTQISLQFWWDEIEDANGYQIQIVSPNFDNVLDLVEDSIVTGDQFVKQFSPGNYEWRIRGVNSETETDFVYRSFQIDSTTNLSAFNLDILSPIDNYASQNLTETFIWEDIYNADYYMFRIFDDGSLLQDPDSISESQTSFTFPEEGVYTWQVNAFNEGSGTNTGWSERTITIDQTTPILPYSFSPLDESEIFIAEGESVELKWKGEHASTDEASITDILQIDDNNGFTNPAEFDLNETGINRTLSIQMDAGIHYWRVKSEDKAGNDSGYSAIQQVKVTIE